MAAHPDLQMILEETLHACYLPPQRVSVERMQGNNFLSQSRTRMGYGGTSRYCLRAPKAGLLL